MEKNLENKIVNKQNPYKLKGIEKIPILGHLSYMNRLDIEGNTITPKENTREYEEFNKAIDYHAISSSILILGYLAFNLLTE